MKTISKKSEHTFLSSLFRKLGGTMVLVAVSLAVAILADLSGIINVDVTFGYGGGGRRSTSTTTTTTTSTTTADTGSVLGEKIYFADIATHWAESYINDLAEQGVVQGRTSGSYEPNEYLTRAEAVKIALEAFNITVDTNLMSSFGDVSAAAWYAPYIATAEKHGLVAGYGNGDFAPGQYINRAEIVKIVLEASKKDLVADTEANFSDIDHSAWYMTYLNYAVDKGILEGYGDGTVKLERDVLRGEMAKIASLAMNI